MHCLTFPFVSTISPPPLPRCGHWWCSRPPCACHCRWRNLTLRLQLSTRRLRCSSQPLVPSSFLSSIVFVYAVLSSLLSVPPSSFFSFLPSFPPSHLSFLKVTFLPPLLSFFRPPLFYPGHVIVTEHKLACADGETRSFYALYG